MSAIPIYNCFNPILKQKAQKITEITPEIKELIVQMLDTIHSTENGVGLAANQVGSAISLFVVDMGDTDEYKEFSPIIFINPELISYSTETSFYNEGCLSIPTFYEDVERPINITIKYNDIHMNEITKEYTGFLARVIQHEYDHLQGILFYERLSAFKKTLSKNKLRKIKADDFDIEYDMINADGNIKKGNISK